MMKLFKFDAYKVTIEPEILMLKPYKKIWDRDKSKNKSIAMQELAFIYFFGDPRSDYQYITDEEDRLKAIKEGEGFNDSWQPDNDLKKALEFYQSFKTSSALLLEDTRYAVDNLRRAIRTVDATDSDDPIKSIRDLAAAIKGVPSLIKDLDEAERSLNKEISEMSRMRGSAEKTIFDDDLNI